MGIIEDIQKYFKKPSLGRVIVVIIGVAFASSSVTVWIMENVHLKNRSLSECLRNLSINEKENKELNNENEKKYQKLKNKFESAVKNCSNPKVILQLSELEEREKDLKTKLSKIKNENKILLRENKNQKVISQSIKNENKIVLEVNKNQKVLIQSIEMKNNNLYSEIMELEKRLESCINFDNSPDQSPSPAGEKSGNDGVWPKDKTLR